MLLAYSSAVPVCMNLRRDNTFESPIISPLELYSSPCKTVAQLTNSNTRILILSVKGCAQFLSP